MSNRAEVHILESVDSGSSGVRVEFFRAGHRWAHRVFGVEAGDPVALLASVEGDDRQPFPPSPALQQLTLEERETRQQVLLLVGMAGKNHWSVSVEVLPISRGIRFDVACRGQPGNAGPLGSTYVALAPWQPAPGTAYVAGIGGNKYALTTHCVGARDVAPSVRMESGQLVVVPSVISDARTQRWCYELRPSTPRP